MSTHSPTPFEVGPPGPVLAGESAGTGTPLVCLHGLTATRRYVLHGSRLLEREGFELVSYDARGHGRSAPAADPAAYEYADLVADLERLLEARGIDRVVLAGHSMGAATAMAYALEFPQRVAAMVQVTPVYDGEPYREAEGLAIWDGLADALERDGVAGFLAAYDPGAEGRWRDLVMAFTRQRLERHDDLQALAYALRIVPRSAAFDGLDRLGALDVPVLVVGSRDEPDPWHPLATAEIYARKLPDAELIVEEPGKPPIAWRGAQLSRAIRDFLARRLGSS